MKIIFLGTASCFPTPERGVSCTALQLSDGQVWLFDCGEGSQIQLMKSQIKLGKITKIFVTHLHGDHLFGLPGLLCTLGNGSNIDEELSRVITVYGPQGIRKFINTALELSRSPLAYRLCIVELIPDDDQYPDGWEEWETDMDYYGKPEMVHNFYHDTKTRVEGTDYWDVFNVSDCDFKVRAGALKHRVPCFGYVIKEREKAGTLNSQKLKELGLKPGPNFAILKNGQDVKLPDGTEILSKDVVGKPIKGRKVAILGDTCDASRMQSICLNADLLLHEATMEDSMKSKAIEYGHSTPSMAIEFADKVKAKQLCLFHLSQRYRPVISIPLKEQSDGDGILGDTSAKLRYEALQARKGPFPCDIVVAEDFMTLDIDLPK